jgi:hypothetical protein
VLTKSVVPFQIPFYTSFLGRRVIQEYTHTHKYNIHGFYTYNTNHCKQISSTNFLEISNFSHKEDKLLKTIQRAVTEGKIYSIES